MGVGGLSNWLFKQHGRTQTIAPRELIDYPLHLRLQRWCRARGALFVFGQTDIVTQPGPTPNPHLILLADAPWLPQNRHMEIDL